MEAGGSTTAVQAAVLSAELDGAGAVEPPAIVLEGWFVKKSPRKSHSNRKRYFVLYDDGMIRYFQAVSPDGEHVGEKGNFRVFKDTRIAVADASGKTGAGRVLLVSSLDTCGLKDREWHLTAESAEMVKQWETKLIEVSQTLGIVSADHRKDMETRKAVEGSVMKRLGSKVASTLGSAQSTMRSFGFGGSVTVSGSLLGMSVSMGLEIEMEEGEGEMEIAGGEGGEDAAAAPDVMSGDEDFEPDDDGLPREARYKTESAEPGDYNEPYDLNEPESPQKESAFRKGIKGGMNKAMGKVKILAFEMKKHKLTGTIGVGFDITMFGTGIEVEFEISLTSCLTETEFEEMLKHEEEIKKAKLEKKKNKGSLSKSRRELRGSSSVEGES